VITIFLLFSGIKPVLLRIAVLALVGCGKEDPPTQPEAKGEPRSVAKKPIPAKPSATPPPSRLSPPKAKSLLHEWETMCQISSARRLLVWE